MNRSRKILLTLALLAVPAVGTAAHSLLAVPESLCFASGAATYQLSSAATSPDYRIRIDNAAPRPDLRMQLVDRPEIADFVLADDFGASERGACRSSVPVRTVRVDAETDAADVTVRLSTDATGSDYRIYVHSLRFSHQDAAGLLAAMWKATQQRKLAERR